MEFRQFVSAGIDVDGLLQASDFFLGALREQGELTGIGREHVASQGSARDNRSNCSIDRRNSALLVIMAPP